MYDLPLTALRALAAVHRTGGVRAAARLLTVTHSTVSRQVRELEARYGVALVEPAGAGLALTPAGRSLAKAASDALGELEAATAAVRERRSPGSVVVATTASVAIRWLLPRLPAFHAAHGRIEVSVLSEQRVIDPDGERVDLVVRQGPQPRTPLPAVALMDDAIYPVIAADHADAGRADADADGRQGPPADAVLIHDRDPETTWARWLAAYPVAGLDPARGPRFTSSDLVIRAAVAGLGYALARERMVADDLRAGTVVRPLGARRIDLPDAYWLIRAASRRTNGPAVDTVVDWLVGEAEG